MADVTYPGIYQKFLNAAEVFNFDLSWMISAGCFVVVDFHGKLLILTLGPILVMLLLSGTYTYVVLRRRASRGALKIVRYKHVSVGLLVMFLVYSSASSTIFQMFDCDSLDDGKDYLRADYTIECDGDKHKGLMIYAGFMILLYPVGIPGLFAYLLFRNRHVLVDEARRANELSVRSISDLWKPYKPSRFYYEVIECGRRIVLTGVILIVDNDSAAQIAVALKLAFVFTVISEGLAPYESQIDAWVSRLGHAVVVSSMYYALLLKVDVSKETHSSQNVFEIVLVVTHVAMVVVVVLEAIATGFSFTQEQVEDPLPRFRPARVWATSRSISVGIPQLSDDSTNSDKDDEIDLVRQTRLQRRTWIGSLNRPRIFCGGDF